MVGGAVQQVPALHHLPHTAQKRVNIAQSVKYGRLAVKLLHLERYEISVTRTSGLHCRVMEVTAAMRPSPLTVLIPG